LILARLLLWWLQRRAAEEGPLLDLEPPPEIVRSDL
jgi:hypothetical protein